MKEYQLKVKSFFERFKGFLQEQITHLEKARAQTKEISEWVAKIGVANIDSITAKAQGKYRTIPEEESGVKIKKHLERAAEFLEGMHFNTSLMSTIPPEWVHKLQKDKSADLLKECKKLLESYSQTESNQSKKKSWLSLPLQLLYLLQPPRSILAIWDKTEPDERNKMLRSMIEIGNKIESDEGNSLLSIPQVSKTKEEEFKLVPVCLHYRDAVKGLVSNIEKQRKAGNLNKERLKEEVDKVQFSSKLRAG